MTKLTLAAAVAVIAINGCSTVTRRSTDTSLTVARGPCFGFCPVYEIRTVGSDHVRFDGIRHTAALGEAVKPVGRATIADALARIAPYRPRSGTSHFRCPDETSDQAVYTITWHTPASSDAALTFNSGCRSTEGRALKTILDGLPAQFGFGAESQQTARPGVSRG